MKNNIINLNEFKQKKIVEENILKNDILNEKNQKLKLFKIAFFETNINKIKKYILEAALIIQDDNYILNKMINNMLSIKKNNNLYGNSLIILSMIDELKKIKNNNIIFTSENNIHIKNLKHKLQKKLQKNIIIIVAGYTLMVALNKKNIENINENIDENTITKLEKKLNINIQTIMPIIIE